MDLGLGIWGLSDIINFQEEAEDIFSRLESLVPALYRATNTFYQERLKI